jgi:NDP-sugar pyrophosphorylase family protein
LLDTGGGLKKAAWFFVEDSTRRDFGSGDSTQMDEPFILHNVDVVSGIDLHRMLQFHNENHALATLAVQTRETSRYLLFNEQLQLCGRRASPGLEFDHEPEIVRPSPHLQPLAFSGIHVISPRLLPMITEEGVFSIIPTYLRFATQGEKILAFRADDYYWRDLGRPADLSQAVLDLQQKALL